MEERKAKQKKEPYLKSYQDHVDSLEICGGFRVNTQRYTMVEVERTPKGVRYLSKCKSNEFMVKRLNLKVFTAF